MKTITVDDFTSFGPCWLEDEAGRRKIKQYAAIKPEWSALDILALDGVSADDKLWLVLRPELLDDAIMHEFACRCAEKALASIENPDQRSVDAITAKRKWMKGEITDAELNAARAAAMDGAMDATEAAARAAADAAVWAALAAAAAAEAAWAAAMDAARAAWGAARDAARDAAEAAAWGAAMDAARAAAEAARDGQVNILISMLREEASK